jgi:hypothetical protein
MLATLAPADLKMARVVVFHSWEISVHTIESVDIAHDTIYLATPPPWPLLKWGPHQRYHIENVATKPLMPGAWCVSSAGNVLYHPRNGEKLSSSDMVYSRLETLVTFAGDPSNSHWVEYITFSGITFEDANYDGAASGYRDPQAGVALPAAVVADGARNIKFDHCEFTRMAAYAVWFRRGCQSCRVTHSHFSDLGGGGVKIGETLIRPNANEKTTDVLVADDVINDVGQTYLGAVGVWVGQSSRNQIIHNDIGRLHYSGISVGWVWGYGPSDAHDNLIAFNLVHDVGMNALNDLGGVYTLGISPGTAILNNLIRDVTAYSKAAWGIYNDEGSSNIRIQDNLVYNTRNGGYHMHYGSEITVSNNIFAFGSESQLQRSRADDRFAFRFVNNIVVWKNGDPLVGNWRDRNITLANNLFFATEENAPRFMGMPLNTWQATRGESGSMVANPEFADLAGADFRLRANSPALGMGFRSFDYSQAGPRTSAQ